jgi:hypothetical protein
VNVAVEGQDYFHVILEQIKNDPELQEIQLWDFTGDDTGSLPRWLRLFKTLEGFSEKVRAIGIIRDAEDDAVAMTQSVATALRNNGFDAPSAPLRISSSKPAVGFLLLPHGRNSGCLEHAILEAAGAQLPLRCAEEFLECVDDGQRNENWRAKVKVHALIAATKNPACTLGQSAKAALWDFHHPSLSVIKGFLKGLCET